MSATSRRAFIRVDFDPGSKIGVSTSTGETAYDALDLSVYGVSFLAHPGDADRFFEGMELPSLAFLIDGRQIAAKGKVVYVHGGLTGGLAKIAVELRSLSAEDVWHLSRHVAEKAGLGEPIHLPEDAIPVRKKKKPKAKKK
jgi:hypothetical protein